MRSKTGNLAMCIVLCLGLLAGADRAEAKRIKMSFGKHGQDFHSELFGRSYWVTLDGDKVMVANWNLAFLMPGDWKLNLGLFVTVGYAPELMGNAFAVIYEGKRYIVIGNNERGAILDNNITVGHEVGHHVCGHTIGVMNDQKLNWARELEADTFSGFGLQTALKNDPRDADVVTEQGIIESAAAIYTDTVGSVTHPPQAMRIAAILNGFRSVEMPCQGRSVAIASDFDETRRHELNDEAVRKLCSPPGVIDECVKTSGWSKKDRYEHFFQGRY